MKKVAVLTNDLQHDLVNKNEERTVAVNAASEQFCSFLESMRKIGCPIIHLQLINREDDPNAERYNGYLPVAKGSFGAEILPQFLDESDLVMEKNKDSGFYETNLDDELKRLHVDTVVITGMQTQICVQTTAADAFFRGYNVWVPEDCVVSARIEDKNRALEWLDGYCATVSNSKDIIHILDSTGSLPRKVIATP